MKKKIYTTIKLILIICVAALMSLGWFVCDDNVFSMYKTEENSTIEPTYISELPNGTRCYHFNIRNVTHTTHSMLFYTNHKEVYVTVAGRLVYSVEKSDSIFGHTTGSVWNRVETPAYSSQVVVMIKPVYPNVAPSETKFYFGDGVAMYENFICGSFIEMAVCLLIIAVGICLVVYFFIDARGNKEILHLGLFASLLGFWSLGETTGVTMLLQQRVMASYCAFTCLMIVGCPFVMFVRYFLHLHNRKICAIVIAIITSIAVFCQLMQFLNIRDIKQNAVLIHFGLFVGCLYMFGGIIHNMIIKKHRRKSTICLVGASVLGIAAVLDTIEYYGDRLNANRYSKFGFLVFIVIISLETARYAKLQLEKERKLRLYQEMAVKDLLTNCYNRNAYNEDIENFDKNQDTYIITFDLNNLKVCNDTMGHNAGDQYIIEAATIIQEVFSHVGKVYRIGGDEFCVVAKGTTDEKLSGLVEKMRKKEREFNTDSPIKLGIAYGMAKYDPKTHDSLEDTRSEADELMYENKKELKKSDTFRRIL